MENTENIKELNIGYSFNRNTLHITRNLEYARRQGITLLPIKIEHNEQGKILDIHIQIYLQKYTKKQAERLTESLLIAIDAVQVLERVLEGDGILEVNSNN